MSQNILPYRDDQHKAARRAEVKKQVLFVAEDGRVFSMDAVDTALSEYCPPESDSA